MGTRFPERHFHYTHPDVLSLCRWLPGGCLTLMTLMNLLCQVSIFSLAAHWASAADSEAFADVLARDDICEAGRYGKEDCSLGLLQLRGKTVSNPLAEAEAEADDKDPGEDMSSAEDEDIVQGTQPFVPLVGPPYGHPSASLKYPTYPGFTLWLAEEFDEPLDLNKDSIWTWSDGGLAEGQVRFVKEQIKFRDGKMIIEVANNVGQVHVEPCSHAEKMTVGPKPLLSGEMRTKNNLFRYGRYEVRMKAPSVQPGNPRINGNFISTMFVYRDSKFQNWREIDFEITAGGPDQVTTNMLRADFQSTWSPGIQSSVHHELNADFPDFNTRADFHTYAFEWLPDKITWYIDGKQVRQQTSGHLKVPDLAGKIMMNLWVFGGGGFGGKQVANNRYPMTAEYEYFRFYKWDGEQQYPCGTMTAYCLAAEDKYLDGNNPCDHKRQEGTVNGMPVCWTTCSAVVR